MIAAQRANMAGKMNFTDFGSESTGVQVHSQPSYAAELLKKFSKMKLNSEFTYVVLCAGGQEFPCHKALLGASSPYFRAMFTSHLSERNSSTITLPEMGATTLSLILNYVYSGEVKLSLNNAQDVLLAADFLNYEGLCSGCVLFLKNNISVYNCLDLIQFADGHAACVPFYDAAMNFLNHNFERVSKTMSLLDVTPEILLRLLSSKQLRNPREDDVVAAALRWLAHDFGNREHHARQIFQNIRLPLVSESVLKQLRRENKIVKQSSFLFDVINEAICCQILSRDGYRVIGAQTYPRYVLPGEQTQMMVVVGGQYHSHEGEVMCSRDVMSTFFDQRHGKDTGPGWTRLAPMPHHLKRKYCVTAIGTKIYVTGGFDIICSRSTNSVWCYSYNRNIWYTVLSMNHARHSHGSAEYHGKLLVVGGKSSLQEKRLNTVEMFDPAGNEWEELDQLPTAVSVPSVLHISGDVYVIGGATEDSLACAKIQIYNTALGIWRVTELTHLLRRKTLCATPLGKRIFMVGGRRPRDVITYSPSTNRETHHKQPMAHRVFPGVITLHEKIWLVGGKTDDGVLDNAEVYEPSTDSWTMLREFLPHGLCMHGCVTLTLEP